MRVMTILIAVVALVSGANALDNASNSTAATMAVADPSRPDSDTTRDADRKPAQTLVFAGINRGTRLPTMSPTQAISRVSSLASSAPNGHVYAVEPPPSSSSSISLRQSRSCRAMPSPIQT